MPGDIWLSVGERRGRQRRVDDGVLTALLDLGDDLAVALVGQRVEEHDEDGEPGGHGRQEAGSGADAPLRLDRLRLDSRDVAADREGVGGEGAADRLAGLAGEREEGVDDALGADTGLPLAVLDRVGLECPHEHVDEDETDVAEHEAREREPRGAGR